MATQHMINAGTWAALDAGLMELANTGKWAVLGPDEKTRMCCGTCSAAELEDTGLPYVYYHDQAIDDDGPNDQADCHLGWSFEFEDANERVAQIAEAILQYGFRMTIGVMPIEGFEGNLTFTIDPRTTMHVTSAPAFATKPGVIVPGRPGLES